MTLADGDFMDLDWSFSKNASRKVAVLLHGLEGNAKRNYIKGAGKVLTNANWDVAAVNYRGCSGETNLLFSSYNAGKTDDLQAIMDFILNKDRYDEMVLIGFSLGGNLLLKYLGEWDFVPKELKKAVAVSAPLSLKGSMESLDRFYNWVYRSTFLKDLKQKYREKMVLFPEKMNVSELKNIKSLLDFDNAYTAPAHGFTDALDYYEKNSSGQFLKNIKIPVLILNAENDSFLSAACYPKELAANSKNLFLEVPKHGGHVGFHISNTLYYSEKRALGFIEE